MTAQAEKLFNTVSSLPEELQNNLVFFWSSDLANENGFDQKLYDTADKLSLLAKEALNDYKSGKTASKGFDEL